MKKVPRPVFSKSRWLAAATCFYSLRQGWRSYAERRIASDLYTVRASTKAVGLASQGDSHISLGAYRQVCSCTAEHH